MLFECVMLRPAARVPFSCAPKRKARKRRAPGGRDDPLRAAALVLRSPYGTIHVPQGDAWVSGAAANARPGKGGQDVSRSRRAQRHACRAPDGRWASALRCSGTPYGVGWEHHPLWFIHSFFNRANFTTHIFHLREFQ